MCLVNRTDDEFTQVLEVYPHAGYQVAGKPGRRLVVLSRTEQAPEHPCGHALAWVDRTLLR
ncbi:hypothetical protein [Nocardioides aurantiacus]|nr:hypothetical protein [Nocardioides aurantiacus]